MSPYLRGIEPLPDELLERLDGPLNRGDAERLRRLIADRKRRIRAARQAWEAEHGPIDVEPPASLNLLLAQP